MVPKMARCLTPPTSRSPATFTDLPEMETSQRLAARLGGLSHAQLLEVAVAGCEASPEVTNQAEAILATHKPLARWAVEGVLLSSDLAPHVLASLQLEDGAAAAVCSLWAEGWKATSEGRRRLTRVAFDFPQELLTETETEGWTLSMAVIPGDDEQLVVSSGYTMHILDRSFSTVTSMDHEPSMDRSVTADEQSVYCYDSMDGIVRLTHNGTEVACYENPDGDTSMYCPVRAPGGLLFCVCYKMDVDSEYEQINNSELDDINHRPRRPFDAASLPVWEVAVQ